MRVKFLLWLFLLILYLTGCSTHFVEYRAPIMPYELPDSLAGQTVCSWNNLPIALVQPYILGTSDAELVVLHEQKHGLDMYNHKGGCWTFYYRYRSDIQFKIDAEYRAYCLEGKAALERNRNPVDIWARIEKALLSIDAVLGSKKANCIY